MNEYTFAQIVEGQEEKFHVKITKEMMDSFLYITGDNNPMHTDYDYANKHGKKDIVVYGMLASSFYSTLCGVYLPGKYCFLHEINTQFCYPVFIGDEISVLGKVIEKDEKFRRIVIKAEIRNGEGKKVNRAKIIAGVLK